MFKPSNCEGQQVIIFVLLLILLHTQVASSDVITSICGYSSISVFVVSSENTDILLIKLTDLSYKKQNIQMFQ